jgi:hypothetical protein
VPSPGAPDRPGPATWTTGCRSKQGGTTSTDNLAPLCRKHHRLKTHVGWTYTSPEPGTYLWVSPHGYTYRRDAASQGRGGGTTDLTPPPAPGPMSGPGAPER